MKEELKASNKTDWGVIEANSEEREFLEGPHSRTFEFIHAFHVFFEMLKGFRKLHFIGPCVTVFGSARFAEGHKYYQLAQAVGSSLGRHGFGVMTGGGPGIMEAANRGARAVNSPSIGCNITLPKEQRPNPYLDCWVEFKYFMVRKFMLAKYSYGFVCLPGGFGTLDELFNVLTLVQTGKMRHFPIVMVGTEFWQPLRDLIEKRLVEAKTIDAQDTRYLYFTDSAEEAALFIQTIAMDQFSLTLKKKPHPKKLLGESSSLERKDR
jgi:uncharacterized protein (TIGR00730 family)